MLTIIPGRFSFMRDTTLVALFLLICSGVGYAQRGDFGGGGFGGGGNQPQNREDEKTTTEILTLGVESLAAGDEEEAIQYFQDYLIAAVGTDMDRAVSINQDVRYKLAILLIRAERKEEAANYLEEYVNTRFATHMRKAYLMLVGCYSQTEQYEKCIEAVLNALEYNENPVIEAGPDFTSLDDEEGVFAEDDEMEDPDAPYTRAEIIALHYAMAEAHFELSQFEECIAPYTYVVDNETDQLRKGRSIMKMINALLAENAIDRIIAWVPELYRTPARYDIQVNLALMDVAEELFAQQEFDSALPLYRMIVPKDELVAYQEIRLQEMRLEAGLPPNLGEELTPEEQILFGGTDDEGSILDRMDQTADAEEEFVIPDEIQELEELLNTLKFGVAPYENYVNLQMAELYKSVNRYWEAVRFYDTVYAATTGSEEIENAEIGDRAMYESVEVLTSLLGAGPAAEARALEYLDSHKSGLYPRLIAYLLTFYYQTNEEWRAILDLRPYVESLDMSNAEFVQYDSQLGFMQGIAELMLANYSNAVERLDYVVQTFPGTSQEPNSLFWCGFSFLCLDDHQSAYECFDRYTRDFPGGRLLDEAYYQGGIALFGQDKLEEAKKRFTYVIETYGTNSTVYSDARNMRADILGSEGELDDAVADYRAAFEAAQRVAQATYATFGMCDIFKVDVTVYTPRDIETAVQLYLAEWADQGADIAKAMLWLGRVSIQQEDYLGAVERYYEVIIDYGGQLQQDGVDQIIPELVKIAAIYLSDEEREDLKTRLQSQMNSTDNPTLQLRLRVTLAQFNNTEDELGKQLLTELEDLDTAPPPVLESICLASLELEDYSRSEEILNIFKENFEDSGYIRSAYKLRAYAQFSEGDLAGAMETIAATQEDFGTATEVAWAQLLKAKILLAQSRVFKSDAPVPQDELQAESESQLLAAQNELQSVNEQLADVDTDEATRERLQASLGEIGLRIDKLQQAVQGSLGSEELRTLLALGKLDEAREENKNVVGVPEWRGSPYAEATYQLGQIEEEAGELLMAHSYYQRVYFQYRGVANGRWGARGYLAAASTLDRLANDTSLSSAERARYRAARISTLKAFLFDKYANNEYTTDLVEEAKGLLGSGAVEDIMAVIEAGTETNIVVNVEADMGGASPASGDSGINSDESGDRPENAGGEA